QLMISAEEFPTPIALRIRLCLFNAGPDRPRTLRTLSPGHEPTVVTVSTPEPVAVRVRTPQHAPGAVATPISFMLDTLDSPFLAGYSADERLLGL
ncbi:hypothetical protein, partial [Escherichia coli]|uniref:hypothetical protein n=2 Tax=Pseudomonadota TaxID=1224 RepID=UPI001AA11D08